MLNKWNELVAMSREQSSALEEARDLLDFKQLVERVMRWIKVCINKRIPIVISVFKLLGFIIFNIKVQIASMNY